MTNQQFILSWNLKQNNNFIIATALFSVSYSIQKTLTDKNKSVTIYAIENKMFRIFQRNYSSTVSSLHKVAKHKAQYTYLGE